MSAGSSDPDLSLFIPRWEIPGPSLKICKTGGRPGLSFSLGAGLEFDFIYVGAGLGVVVPLSNETQTILDLAVRLGVSF